MLVRTRSALLAVTVATVALSMAAPLHAQRTAAAAAAPPAYDGKLYSDPNATNKNFKNLRWRLVGPFRGGRVDAVAGDPTKPLVFYMGSVNGGVWKTANA